MSLKKVLDTIKAAVQDPVTGLQARATAIATAEALGVVTDFRLEKWMLSGEMKPSGIHNVAIAPANAAANLKLPHETQRDAVHSIVIGFETFSADTSVLEDTVLVFAQAVLQVLDRLREFSDANGGTILQVFETVGMSFGTFTGGGATSSGFTASVNIQERSTL